MAEAETIASPTTEQAQPAPVLTSMDGLDAAMANARATASTDSSTSDQAAPDRSAQPAGTDPSTATTTQPASDDAPEGDDEGTPPAPGEPQRPSRMGRLREQLTQAEQRTRAAEAAYQQRMAQDAAVADKYRGLLGSPEERQQLNATLANPNSPAYEVNQARQRLAQMTQAATELAPLRQEVERSVFDHFSRGMDQLRTLDGMDEQAHQSLFKAPSGVDALKIMHTVGQKAAEDKYRGEVSSLKAQLADVKRQLAANGQQPARAGGLASNGSSGLAGLLGADGLPTEEAISAARRGELRQRFASST